MDKVGTLTIGCYWSVAAMLLPDILRAFLKDYPQVHIELREGTNDELAQLLRERAVDFSFSAQPSPNTPCDWLPILDDELLVWLPEHHPEFISYIKEAFPEPAGNASS
ncbi:MAG: hypothetical protein ACFWTM_00175 [Mitsuokella multacida]|jgi:DNA-binding transcriptional LysR family regulator